MTRTGSSSIEAWPILEYGRLRRLIRLVLTLSSVPAKRGGKFKGRWLPLGAIRTAVSSGLRGLVERNELAPWMGREAMAVARSMFARNQNGIGLTEIAFDDENRLVINRGVADSGIRAIEAIDPTSLDVVVGSREAWGEIQGTMVAAGRYKNKAAVQMLTDQYGAVWCQLSDREVHDLGDNVKIGTVWEGKTIGVEGRLMYSAVGKLLILDAKVRIVADVPLISLESVLDPDFTSGLDPVEYLRLFHEGELAG